MELAVVRLAIVCFFVIGVSHILKPRVWAQFFARLHDLGEVGSFINALLHFPLGVIIVSFHNVWRGLPIVLTLIGWSLVLKSCFYFVFPHVGIKVLKRASRGSIAESIVAGIFSIGISVLLLLMLLTK